MSAGAAVAMSRCGGGIKGSMALSSWSSKCEAPRCSEHGRCSLGTVYMHSYHPASVLVLYYASSSLPLPPPIPSRTTTTPSSSLIPRVDLYTSPATHRAYSAAGVCTGPFAPNPTSARTSSCRFLSSDRVALRAVLDCSIAGLMEVKGDLGKEGGEGREEKNNKVSRG